jgi:hypothetical protein
MAPCKQLIHKDSSNDPNICTIKIMLQMPALEPA